MTTIEPSSPAIALAVLDMAGTTVADGGLVTKAFRAALRAVGVPEDDPDHDARLTYVAATMGQPKLEVFTALLGDPGRATDALAAFDASMAASVDNGEVAALPGSVDAIDALRSAGVRVCLTTGFSEDVQRRIVDHLGWSARIDLALAPGPGRRGRPHPDLVLSALMALEIDDVRQVAVAGDTTNDLWSGHRAGAGIVAGVLTGAHDRQRLAEAPHTHVLSSIAELPGVVAGHG